MEVIVMEEIEQDLRELPYEVREEVKAWREKLESNPYLGQLLERELRGARKLYVRQAQYRIIYMIHQYKLHILIIAIGKREDSEVYRIAKKRLDTIR